MHKLRWEERKKKERKRLGRHIEISITTPLVPLEKFWRDKSNYTKKRSPMMSRGDHTWHQKMVGDLLAFGGKCDPLCRLFLSFFTSLPTLLSLHYNLWRERREKRENETKKENLKAYQSSDYNITNTIKKISTR